MKKIIDAVTKYAKVAWKWIRIFAGTKTARWLINSMLVPAIMAFLQKKGWTLPVEVIQMILQEVTGQAIGAATAIVSVGAGIAAGGTLFANEKWADVKAKREALNG